MYYSSLTFNAPCSMRASAHHLLVVRLLLLLPRLREWLRVRSNDGIEANGKTRVHSSVSATGEKSRERLRHDTTSNVSACLSVSFPMYMAFSINNLSLVRRGIHMAPSSVEGSHPNAANLIAVASGPLFTETGEPSSPRCVKKPPPFGAFVP